MKRYELSIEPVDIVAIERQARALRAQAIAEMTTAAWAWVVARLRRAPVAQAA